MWTIDLAKGPMTHYNRLRAYLARRRRARKAWSQQHEDAWQVLKSLQELLTFLESCDRTSGGSDIHLTSLLRAYGRETEADRRRADLERKALTQLNSISTDGGR